MSEFQVDPSWWQASDGRWYPADQGTAAAGGTPAATTPAGWYPDPAGGPGSRYWDGSAWTEHTSGGPEPEPEPSTAVVPYVAPAQEAPALRADWHQDPHGPAGQLRYHDGTSWTEHVHAPAPPTPMGAYQQPVPQTIVVGGGGGAAATAVAVSTGPNHLLHFILTVVTCGLWLPVWIVIAIFGRKKVSVATSSSAGGGAPVVIQTVAPQQQYYGQQNQQQGPPPGGWS